jgi:hypothetical protein
VFLGYKKLLSTKGKGLRWVRNVGLGVKTPAAAVKVSTERLPRSCNDSHVFCWFATAANILLSRLSYL